MITINNKNYLTSLEAAEKFGFSVHWFNNARVEGFVKNPPPYLKVSGKIFYEETALEKWFVSCEG